MIFKFFFAFYKKTFYTESMIVLYDIVSMQFLFLFGFLSFFLLIAVNLMLTSIG